MSGLLVKREHEPIAVETMEAAKQVVAKLSPGTVIVTAIKIRHVTAKELINWLKEEGDKLIIQNLHLKPY